MNGVRRLFFGAAGVWLCNPAVMVAQVAMPVDKDTKAITQVARPDRFVGNAISMDFGEASLWVCCHTDGPIFRHQEGNTYRIDPKTGQTLAKIPVSGCVAVGEGAIWVRHGPEFIGARALPENQGKLSKIDPRTNRIVATIEVDRWSGVLHNTGNMAVGEGGVWLISRQKEHLVRIDPRSHEVIATIPLGATPFVVHHGEGKIWVLAAKRVFSERYKEPQLHCVDPKLNKVTASIDVTSPRGSIAVGEGCIWVVEPEQAFSASGKAHVRRFNVANFREEAKPISLPTTPIRAVLLGQGGLWVGQGDPAGDTRSGIFTFISAASGQTKVISTPFMRGPSAYGDQALWVTTTWSIGTYLDRVRP